MKKFLLLHFWFGKKNRTYGLTYSCFEYFFLKKEIGKNQGKKKEMLLSAYTFFFIFTWQMFSRDCCVKELSLERSREKLKGS